MVFPLEKVPGLSYKLGGRRFGAKREGGRQHAGCDLIVPLGTPIFSVATGRVLRGPYAFYHGTFAIEVQHHDYMARYCEIKGCAPGVQVGSVVAEGQLIAYVGKMFVDSMLHFEMYSDSTNTAGLTDKSRPPFMRRRDLVDPAPYLDEWAARL